MSGRCPWLAAVALALSLPAAPAPASGQCSVTGEAPSSDLGLARAGCERAVAGFAELFGSRAQLGELVISDSTSALEVESHHPVWRVRWPTTARIRDYLGHRLGVAALADEVELQWETVLPHELGHVLLNAEIYARTPAGAPFRRPPDWLQEGVGVWMEPPQHRADEFGILRALRPFIPTVGDIVELSLQDAVDDDEAGSTIIQTFFPCVSEAACGGRPHWSRIFSVVTRQFPDGRVQVDTVFHERAPPPPDPLASNAYAYSATLLRFVHDLGGAAATSALLDRYVAGRAGLRAILGLPGLPADTADVEAAWRDWFARNFFRE